MTIKSYTDLEAWNLAMDLATEVHRLGKLMPKAEQYGMKCPTPTPTPEARRPRPEARGRPVTSA